MSQFPDDLNEIGGSEHPLKVSLAVINIYVKMGFTVLRIF